MTQSVTLSPSAIEARINLLRSIDSDTAERFAASERFEFLPLYVALRQAYAEAPSYRLRNIMHKFMFMGYQELPDGTAVHCFKNVSTRRYVRFAVSEQKPEVLAVTGRFDRLTLGTRQDAGMETFLAIAPEDADAYYLQVTA